MEWIGIERTEAAAAAAAATEEFHVFPSILF